MDDLARTIDMSSPLAELRRLRQSIWLDDIRRQLMTSGALSRLVDDSGVTGVTANPSIFEKAILESTDYEGALAALVGQGFRDDKAVYEALAISDI